MNTVALTLTVPFFNRSECLMSWNLRGLLATAAVSGLLCASASAQSPMGGISTKMTEVTGELAKTETGKPVQEEQASIVRDLDELIAQLEKQCEGCKAGMRKNRPTSPARDSTLGSGPGGMGNLVNPGESAKDWAKLSPRERDRILQSMSEGFPPEYRTVLERYYRRLAEEKTVAPGTEKAQPKGDEKPADKP
jgi:hypothetical protein